MLTRRALGTDGQGQAGQSERVPLALAADRLKRHTPCSAAVGIEALCGTADGGHTPVPRAAESGGRGGHRRSRRRTRRVAVHGQHRRGVEGRSLPVGVAGLVEHHASGAAQAAAGAHTYARLRDVVSFPVDSARAQRRCSRGCGRGPRPPPAGAGAGALLTPARRCERLFAAAAPTMPCPSVERTCRR